MTMMLRKFGLLSLIALLVSQLSACGFHLRGTGSTGVLPFASVHIQQDAGVNQTLSMALQRQFSQSGVTVVGGVDDVADKVSDKAVAQVQLQLTKTGYTASQTSASGLGDSASEVIKMSQTFKLMDMSSEKTLSSGTVTAYRDRQINNSASLASDSELRSIQKSMSQQLARQIMDRIQRTLAANNTQNNPVNTQVADK